MFESPANKRAQEKWMKDALSYTMNTLMLIQSEAGYIAEVERLVKLLRNGGVLTKEEKEWARYTNDSLEQYDKAWWFHNRDHHRHLFNKPKGSYVRYHDLFVEGHLSYTREQAEMACRALGGCCAYDCGCCSVSKASYRMDRPWVFIHCARSCHCCVKRRQPDAGEDFIVEDIRAQNTVVYNYLRGRSHPLYDSDSI